MSEAQELEAAPLPLEPDQDGDGLVDSLEALLHTSVDRADTDGDGFDDAEEVARRARPNIRRARPEAQPLSINMSTYGADGLLHVVAAIYVEEGQLSDVSFFMGALVQGRLIEFTRSEIGSMSEVSIVPTRDPRDVVMLIDVEVDPQRVLSLGQLSFYGIAGRHSSGDKSVDVLDLFATPDGVILNRQGPEAMAVTIGDTTQVTSQGASHTGGSTFQPIPMGFGGGGDFLPATWTPEQICQQLAQDVGGSGGVVTREIVEAGCEDSWDAHCSPGCSSAIGTTYQTLDPLALAGG